MSNPANISKICVWKYFYFHKSCFFIVNPRKCRWKLFGWFDFFVLIMAFICFCKWTLQIWAVFGLLAHQIFTKSKLKAKQICLHKLHLYSLIIKPMTDKHIPHLIITPCIISSWEASLNGPRWSDFFYWQLNTSVFRFVFQGFPVTFQSCEFSSPLVPTMMLGGNWSYVRNMSSKTTCPCMERSWELDFLFLVSLEVILVSGKGNVWVSVCQFCIKEDISLKYKSDCKWQD